MITKSTTRIHAQTTPVMKERFRQRSCYPVSLQVWSFYTILAVPILCCRFYNGLACVPRKTLKMNATP